MLIFNELFHGWNINWNLFFLKLIINRHHDGFSTSSLRRLKINTWKSLADTHFHSQIALFSATLVHHFCTSAPKLCHMNANWMTLCVANGCVSGPRVVLVRVNTCMYFTRYSIKCASSYLLLRTRLHLSAMWAHQMRFATTWALLSLWHIFIIFTI